MVRRVLDDGRRVEGGEVRDDELIGREDVDGQVQEESPGKKETDIRTTFITHPCADTTKLT